MKVGISVKLDVTKIDKARLFVGEKGTYLDLTMFVDLSELDQYGNSGFVTQEQTKEERETKTQLPILGNSKVFWKDVPDEQRARQNKAGMADAKAAAAPPAFDPLDDGSAIPF